MDKTKGLKTLLVIIIWLLGTIAIWFAVGTCANILMMIVKHEPFTFLTIIKNYCLDIRIILISVGIGLCLLIWYFIKYFKYKAKPKTERADSNLHDSNRFLTEKEVNELYGNKKTKQIKRFSNIANEEVNGMVINTIQAGNDVFFNSAEGLHSLIVGTTGTGKTKRIMIPSIECMARSKTKPSFVNLDVKGEIYDLTHANLEAQGYTTFLVNLRDPNSPGACKFNPFGLVMYYWKKYLKSGEKDIIAMEKTYDLIRQVCSMFNPSDHKSGGSGDNAFWDNASMSVMEAYIWSLLENYQICAFKEGSPFKPMDARGNPIENLDDDPTIKGKINKIINLIPGFGTEEGVTFTAMQAIANLSPEDLLHYLSWRDTQSRTYKTAHANIINHITEKGGNFELSKTLQSLLSVYETNYKRIITETIQSIAERSDFDVKALYEGDKPFAIFILMPDEDKNKYPFAGLMISEIYQFFTSLSQEKGFGSKVKRRSVHFLMDEFANLNPMENIDNWLSVGRERKLFCHLFIQGISQLNEKYGAEKTKTIIGNCNMKIFMALAENEVIDYAVKLFGTYTIKQSSVSASTDKRSGDTNYSSSTSFGQANLVNPGDFIHMKDGNIYFLETKKFPGKGFLGGTWNGDGGVWYKPFGYNN